MLVALKTSEVGVPAMDSDRSAIVQVAWVEGDNCRNGISRCDGSDNDGRLKKNNKDSLHYRYILQP